MVLRGTRHMSRRSTAIGRVLSPAMIILNLWHGAETPATTCLGELPRQRPRNSVHRAGDCRLRCTLGSMTAHSSLHQRLPRRRNRIKNCRCACAQLISNRQLISARERKVHRPGQLTGPRSCAKRLPSVWIWLPPTDQPETQKRLNRRRQLNSAS
jgi:hypothetical protein